MNSKLFRCVLALLTVFSAKSTVASNSPGFKLINDASNPNTASDGLKGHLVQVQEFVMRLLETMRSFMTNLNRPLTEEDAVSPLPNPVQGRLCPRGNPEPPPTGKPDNSKKQTPPPNAWKPRDDESPGDFGNF
uniref:Uncharacterized protein n=1 Tax=Cacopsylla melanoneura TaxID=428564 RepID=A0A8D8V0Q1_9HEMI